MTRFRKLYVSNIIECKFFGKCASTNDIFVGQVKRDRIREIYSIRIFGNRAHRSGAAKHTELSLLLERGGVYVYLLRYPGNRSLLRLSTWMLTATTCLLTAILGSVFDAALWFGAGTGSYCIVILVLKHVYAEQLARNERYFLMGVKFYGCKK